MDQLGIHAYFVCAYSPISTLAATLPSRILVGASENGPLLAHWTSWFQSFFPALMCIWDAARIQDRGNSVKTPYLVLPTTFKILSYKQENTKRVKNTVQISHNHVHKIMETVINGKYSVWEVSRPSIPIASKGPSHPDQRCYRLNVRVWLLYFIPSMSKQTKLLWNYIIKHTFRNTAYSKATRFGFTAQYQ